jgi:hypothetical protein
MQIRQKFVPKNLKSGKRFWKSSIFGQVLCPALGDRSRELMRTPLHWEMRSCLRGVLKIDYGGRIQWKLLIWDWSLMSLRLLLAEVSAKGGSTVGLDMQKEHCHLDCQHKTRNVTNITWILYFHGHIPLFFQDVNFHLIRESNGWLCQFYFKIWPLPCWRSFGLVVEAK